jgi:hypothetical protein
MNAAIVYFLALRDGTSPHSNVGMMMVMTLHIAFQQGNMDKIDFVKKCEIQQQQRLRPFQEIHTRWQWSL